MPDIYLNAIILLLACFGFSPGIQQDNTAPVVKIISPKNNATIQAGAPINYQINVADKEDGNSAYDEINIKEVLLEVKQMIAKQAAALSEPAAITIMRTSNCFNCHNFTGKSIGPSFYDISKRYPGGVANTDSLVKRIRMGSSEIWGKEKMPAHPELTAGAIKTTVNWVLKHATDPGIEYYIGTTGIIRLKDAGRYRLTASYLDHGLKMAPGRGRLKGSDAIYISVK